MKMFYEMSSSTKCKESDKCGRPKSPKNQTVESALAPDRETALDVFLMSTSLHTSVAMSAVYTVIGTIPQHHIIIIIIIQEHGQRATIKLFS